MSKQIESREQSGCMDCMGTGIGWNGPDSNCRICSGTGINRQPTSIDEDSQEPWNVDLCDDMAIRNMKEKP